MPALQPVHPARRRSLWLEEALALEPDAESVEPLTGSHRADVCIVGGGYTGLWTALRLRELDPTLDILVLEADLCGSGASGRNGGFTQGWWPKLDALTTLLGEDEGVRTCNAAANSVTEIGDVLRGQRHRRALPPRWLALDRDDSTPRREMGGRDCRGGETRAVCLPPALPGRGRPPDGIGHPRRRRLGEDDRDGPARPARPRATPGGDRARDQNRGTDADDRPGAEPAAGRAHPQRLRRRRQGRDRDQRVDGRVPRAPPGDDRDLQRHDRDRADSRSAGADRLDRR